MHNNLDKVVYLKMVSGENILAQLEMIVDDDFYILLHPLQVFLTNTQLGGSLRAAKWIPFIEDSEVIEIRQNHVMTFGEPTQEIEEYYFNCLQRIQTMEDRAKRQSEILTPDHPDYNEEEDIEIMKALMQKSANTNIQIH